jgi:hypothetical protein
MEVIGFGKSPMTPIFKTIPCQCAISIPQSPSHGTDEKPDSSRLPIDRRYTE